MGRHRLLGIFLILTLLFFPHISNSDPLDNWQWRNPLPQGNSLNGVTYGNGIFVVVGDLGTIFTSPDGVTWTQRSSGTTYNLNAVTYGNGIFVAVGETILTSPDGVAWTESNPGIHYSLPFVLNGVAYGNGNFVAVGYDWILVSTDGVAWTNRLVVDNFYYLRGATYGNGTFVVVGAMGDIVPYGVAFTSTDGLTWIKHPSPGMSFSSVTYGNNVFVAAGHGTIQTSPDGITWTSQSLEADKMLFGVTFGNGMFVAVGETVLSSPDGNTWTEANPGIEGFLYGIYYGNGVFVAVGTGGKIVNSFDGVTWGDMTSGTTKGLSAATYGNDTFMAVGAAGTILTSSDGVMWIERTSGTSSNLNTIAYGSGLFVAAGETILTSPDGVTWTEKQEFPLPYPIRGIAYGDGTFVAVSSAEDGSHNSILTSTDGLSWDRLPIAGIGFALNEVTYGNGTFVVVGSGIILVSSQGEARERVGPGPQSFSGGESVTYGNGIFVTIGLDGDVYTSKDGKVWSNEDQDLGYGVQSVSYGNGIFAVVGDYTPLGRYTPIFTSSEGKTWTRREPGTNNSLKGVAYGSGTFIVVGESGTILQSDPVAQVETVSVPDTPGGPTKGVPGQSYSYSTGGAISNLAHSVEYQFDWRGDGSDLSDWGSATQSKTWTSGSVYTVRARARCARDISVVSDWSNGLSVAINVPDISVVPMAYDFGNLKIGRGKTASFRVKNTGKADLLISTSITGAEASMFTVMSGSGSKAIKPGRTLIIRVGFKPVSPGSKSSTLTITSNDPDTSITEIPLSGRGQ